MLTIGPADLADPALAAFLAEHLADLEPTAPPESRHALDLAALSRPGVRLRVGHEDGRIVATAALAALTPGHEELKSMRTAPDRRRRGIARLMVRHALTDARGRGVRRISLETGSAAFFAPARALYLAEGFRPCPPFGSYTEDPNSVFLTLALG